MQLSSLTGVIGATLLHSLWQGALVALALAALLGLMRKSSASARFAVIFGALLTLAAWTGITFIQEWKTQQILDSQPLVQLTLPAFPEGFMPAGGQPLPSMVAPEPEISLQAALTTWQDRLAVWLEPAQPYLAEVWLVGMLLFLTRWLGGLWYLNRYRGPLSQPADTQLQCIADALSHRLGLWRAAEVRLSAAVQVPFVLGYFRPLVVLPLELATGLTPAQLEAVLAHELAHLRRYDFALNLCVSLLESFFFYHPAFWWMSARLGEEREHACDDLAVSLLDRRIYAEALYVVGARERAASARMRPAYAQGLFQDKQELLSRIKRIMLCDNHQRSMNRFIPLSLLALALTAFFWLTPARSIAANVQDVFTDLKEDLSNVLESIPMPEPPEPPAAPAAPAASQAPGSLLSSLRDAILNLTVVDTPPPPVAPVAPVAPVPPVYPGDAAAPLPPLPPLPPADLADPADPRRFRMDTDGDGIAEVDIAYNFDLDRTLTQIQADLARAHAEIQREIENIRRNRELSPRERQRIEEQLERAGEDMERQMENMEEQIERAMEQAQAQRERADELRTQRREILEQEREARLEAARAQAEVRRAEAEIRAEEARQRAEQARTEAELRSLSRLGSLNSNTLYEYSIRGLAEKDGLIKPGAKITLDIDEKTVTLNGKKLDEKQSLPYLSVTAAFIGAVKPGSTVVFEYQQ